MKLLIPAALLLVLPLAAHAAKFADAVHAADQPQAANGRDVVRCEMVRTIYSDTPQQVCLTAGQRMTSAANAEAAASQKAISDRGLRDARAAAGAVQDAASH